MDLKAMKESQRKYTITSMVLITSSIFLILFSFVAPTLFTLSSETWDFKDTGSIGDTIGGIMNPFIAIAGILSTFLAFLIQVRANEIQRNQFIASLKKSFVDEEIDSYNKLKLLCVDIDETIKDIDKRIKYLDECLRHIRENPYNYAGLYRATLKHYDRIVSIERLSIFKGFQHFLCEEKDWIQKFNSLYSILDYVPEGLKELYSVVHHHNEDIYNDKMTIRKLFDNLNAHVLTI